MELQGQDLTNLPLGLSLPRPKLPVFTYQPQPELLEGRVPLMNPQPVNSMQQLYAQPALNQQSHQVHCLVGQNQPKEAPLGQYHCEQEQENVLTNCDDSGFDLMDDSLTDMQWLQRMDAGTCVCVCVCVCVCERERWEWVCVCVYVFVFTVMCVYNWLCSISQNMFV